MSNNSLTSVDPNEIAYGVVPVDWQVQGFAGKQAENVRVAGHAGNIGRRVGRAIAEHREEVRSYFVGQRAIVQRRSRKPIDEAEARRLIDEAIAAGRVTYCPPAVVEPVNNGAGL